ncbi:MAG: hypothetical protein JWP59_3994, partial [Massilia sp.]|nr:hypothetical protein [Massilia sp.]
MTKKVFGSCGTEQSTPVPPLKMGTV